MAQRRVVRGRPCSHGALLMGAFVRETFTVLPIRQLARRPLQQRLGSGSVSARQSVRHSSSISKSTTATREGKSSALADAINPPASTRPPPLETPVRKPDQSAPLYCYSLGKSYVNFYKTGLKAVWANYKAAQELRKSRLQGGQVSADEALRQGQITRGEWHLLRRSAADVRKIPLFGLVLMVCGEFTPLVVIAISDVVPQTCHIPRQVSKEREKLELRRKESFRRGDSLVDAKELEAGRRLSELQNTQDVVKHLRWEQLLHISRALGLYAKLWDTLWDYPPQWILRRRVERFLDYVQLDDEALMRYGGPAQLQSQELQSAAVSRGIDVLGCPDAHIKETLERWLKAKRKQSVPYLVLTRPNVWEV